MPRPLDFPLPEFFHSFRGVGGDFREGLAKPDFLADFKIFYSEDPRDESGTFRTKPKNRIWYRHAARWGKMKPEGRSFFPNKD